MMKAKIIIFLLIVISVGVWAQNADSPNRDISLKIVNKRGRAVRNVIVHSVNSGNIGVTDRTGLFIFSDMSDDDNISIMLPRYGEVIVPVAGFDSIVVTLRSASSYSYVDKDGEKVLIHRNKAEPTTLLDVPLLLKQRGYTSLVGLLQGHAPGLNISAGNSPGEVTANIRGTSSLRQSNEPLVVVDGIPVGTISEADRSVNVYDIKTIEILRTAPDYGIRGANGVILIITNTGGR